MNFVLQNDGCSDLERELFDIKRLITSTSLRFSHTFCEISTLDADSFDWNKGVNIPVGTLEFTKRALLKMGVTTPHIPVEIPIVLRTPEFLGRHYAVYKFKDLPETGRYFVKDVSQLKAFTPQVFSMDEFKAKIACLSPNYENHEYALSDELDIKSEFRVFVCNKEIEAIQHYDGDCRVFPDIDKINTMMWDITYARELGANLPRSYTLDVAVTPDGTFVLEVHNFVSCGTYGFDGEALLWMYRDGVDFELEEKRKRLCAKVTDTF